MDSQFRKTVIREVIDQSPGMIFDLRYIESEESLPSSNDFHLDSIPQTGYGNLHLTYDPSLTPPQFARLLLAGLTEYRLQCFEKSHTDNSLYVPFQWLASRDNPGLLA